MQRWYLERVKKSVVLLKRQKIFHQKHKEAPGVAQLAERSVRRTEKKTHDHASLLHYLLGPSGQTRSKLRYSDKMRK